MIAVAETQYLNTILLRRSIAVTVGAIVLIWVLAQHQVISSRLESCWHLLFSPGPITCSEPEPTLPHNHNDGPDDPWQPQRPMMMR